MPSDAQQKPLTEDEWSQIVSALRTVRAAESGDRERIQNDARAQLPATLRKRFDSEYSATLGESYEGELSEEQGPRTDSEETQIVDEAVLVDRLQEVRQKRKASQKILSERFGNRGVKVDGTPGYAWHDPADDSMYVVRKDGEIQQVNSGESYDFGQRGERNWKIWRGREGGWHDQAENQRTHTNPPIAPSRMGVRLNQASIERPSAQETIVDKNKQRPTRSRTSMEGDRVIKEEYDNALDAYPSDIAARLGISTNELAHLRESQGIGHVRRLLLKKQVEHTAKKLAEQMSDTPKANREQTPPPIPTQTPDDLQERIREVRKMLRQPPPIPQTPPSITQTLHTPGSLDTMIGNGIHNDWQWLRDIFKKRFM